MVIRSSSSFTRFCCLLALVGLLGGCHSLFGSDKDSDKNKVVGKRISVLQATHKVEVDKSVQDLKIKIPDERTNAGWEQTGGNAEHTSLNAALGTHPEDFWSASVGKGSDSDYKLIARPVIEDRQVFAMDAEGEISAFSLTDGDRAWRFDTKPEDRDTQAMGGGLGISDGVLYATTGFGEVLALKTSDGSVVWRQMVGKPLRAAPTIADGRVFVVTIDNELNALSATNGEILWHHSGIVESATLMGASAPAVSGDNVVVAYSSGEIFNLRVQNGRVAWSDVLAMPAQMGAMPAIADIRGNPVIDHGTVYAVSHSGRMAAIDLRTGDRVWDVEIGGTNSPVVTPNALFVLSNDNELVALARDSGRVIWLCDLQKLEDPSDHDSARVFWSGPVLAGGMLWLTNSLGGLSSFSISDGTELYKEIGDEPFFLPPIVADDTIFTLSDEGSLKALK